ncbi:MAG: hypothetical protein DDT29_02423 [Dehalococcoidia bacterium]|nr:hypothetical protein [Bacillota bacterium]
MSIRLKPIIAVKTREQQGIRTDLCQISDKGLEPIDTKEELARAAGPEV